MVRGGVVGDEGRCSPGQGGPGAGVHNLRAPRRRLPLLLVPVVMLLVILPLLLPLLLPCAPCGLSRHIRTHLRRQYMVSIADGDMAMYRSNVSMHKARANVSTDIYAVDQNRKL